VLHRLPVPMLQYLRPASTIGTMKPTDRLDRHFPTRVKGSRLAFGATVCMMVATSFAAPPQGRMPPEERQRLRQELRQHSGSFQNRPFGALGVPQNSGNPGSTGTPSALGQVPVQSAPLPTGASPAGVSPNPPQSPRQYPPGFQPPPGRLSDDDRRALRQQLREQRAHREGPFAVPNGPGPTSMPASAPPSVPSP
jgi:uncharacterized membrane protein